MQYYHVGSQCAQPFWLLCTYIASHFVEARRRVLPLLLKEGLGINCRVATLLWELAHLNVLPVISLELRSPPPQFSLKLAFLHKLLKFKFLPQDTLLNIFSPKQLLWWLLFNFWKMKSHIAWFHQRIKVDKQCDQYSFYGWQQMFLRWDFSSLRW